MIATGWYRVSSSFREGEEEEEVKEESRRVEEAAERGMAVRLEDQGTP